MEDLRPWLRRLVSEDATERSHAGIAIFGFAGESVRPDSSDFPSRVFQSAVQMALADLDAAPLILRLIHLEAGFWDGDLALRLTGRQATAPDYLAHFGAHAVLSSVGPPGRAAVAAFLELLDHTEPVLRDVAIQALGSMGADARPALAALLAKVAPRGKDCHPFKLGQAVAHIAGEEASCLHQVLALLDGRTELEARAGLGILSEMEARAESAASAVMGLTRSSRDAETRSIAASTLGAIARRSAPPLLDQVVDRLIEMTRAPEWFIRGNAVGALGVLSGSGHRIAEIVAAIVPSVGDDEGDDWNAHEAAVSALVAVGRAALPILDTLAAHDGRRRADIRKVIRRIRGLGPS